MINHFRLKPTDVLFMHKIFIRRFLNINSLSLRYNTIYHGSLTKRNKKCSDFFSRTSYDRLMIK
jgi:hypothetical protein